jgi:tetratricopeptide (TPR) repeat protein
VADLRAFKYRVFLSYSHRDKVWGKWLQSALVHYDIDEDIVGRWTPAGSVPRRLGPIYRDREATSADRLPSERTLAALRASQYLIVLCSPHAAKSRRVNEQIRRFTALGRADRVIPVIVDGEPGDPERECFVPALRFRLGPDRLLVDRRGEPLAADARLDRDGKDRVKHKVAAALLCLGLAEVERRARRARRRRLRVRCGGVVAGLLALSLACEGGFAWARHQLSRNETLLDRTLERGAVLAGGVATASKQLGVPANIAAPILESAEDLLHGMTELGRATPRLQVRKASMLVEFAGMYADLGSSSLAGTRAAEANRLLQKLAAELPNKLAWQRELSLLRDGLGRTLQAQGRVTEALASYRASLAIAERLAADARSFDRHHELALRHVNLGEVNLDRRAFGAALASFQSSLAIARRVAAADPGKARWQQALVLAHERIGDVLRLRGELDAALPSYYESRAAAERLVAVEPGNAEWQRGLSTLHLKIGDVLALQDRAEEALASYRSSSAIAGRLAAADPGRQKHLGIAHERIGIVLEGRGQLDAALMEFQANLAIARRVAAADPGNRDWQRALGIAHQHIGDALRLRGDLGGALRHYQADRAIVSRLLAADPAHAGWQSDLGASQARIGLMLESLGDFEAAVKEYEACVALGGRLAAADSDNPAAQRELAVSYGRLAAVRHRLGKTGQALAELRKGRRIMAGLLEAAPGLEQWKQDLARFDGRIAALEGRAQAVAKIVPATGSPAVASAAAGPAERLRVPAALRLPPKL